MYRAGNNSCHGDAYATDNVIEQFADLFGRCGFCEVVCDQQSRSNVYVDGAIYVLLECTESGSYAGEHRAWRYVHCYCIVGGMYQPVIY